jgi:hypothetical protein
MPGRLGLLAGGVFLCAALGNSCTPVPVAAWAHLVLSLQLFQVGLQSSTAV